LDCRSPEFAYLSCLPQIAGRHKTVDSTLPNAPHLLGPYPPLCGLLFPPGPYFQETSHVLSLSPILVPSCGGYFWGIFSLSGGPPPPQNTHLLPTLFVCDGGLGFPVIPCGARYSFPVLSYWSVSLPRKVISSLCASTYFDSPPFSPLEPSPGQVVFLSFPVPPLENSASSPICQTFFSYNVRHVVTFLFSPLPAQLSRATLEHCFPAPLFIRSFLPLLGPSSAFFFNP